MSKKRKPYAATLVPGRLRITCYDADALIYVESVTKFGVEPDGEPPDAKVAIWQTVDGKELAPDFYDAAGAITKLQFLLEKGVGVRWIVKDGKLALFVDDEEVNSWPTDDSVRKTDQWIQPVANYYLDEEVVEVMFPDSDS